MNETREGALAYLQIALDLLQALGFLINLEKSVLEPSKMMEHLGMVINSVELSFTLPASKVQDVKRMCERALSSGQVILRVVASILGNFT